jgi:hypothetical protein
MISQKAYITTAAISISALLAYAYISTRNPTLEQRIETRKKGPSPKETQGGETKNNETNKE